MKYLLLISAEESVCQAYGDAAMTEILGGFMKFNEEATAAGVLLAAQRLRPVSTATTLRVRDGKTMLTDGPFAETKEQVGGFYMIDVPDLDAALAWAAKLPAAKYGSIEVRPIWPPEEYRPC